MDSFSEHPEPTVPDAFPTGTSETRTLDALAAMAGGKRSSDDDTTVHELDLPRALRDVRAIVSRVESLACAARCQYDALQYGPPADLGRRAKRLDDLLTAGLEAAQRALEAVDRLTDEVTAAASGRA